MPDIEIKIGDKPFTVSCQPGEEHFLRAAAAMLNAEATPLVAQLGRLPETRMLLMAGLMLADKTAALEDDLRATRARLAEAEARPVPPRERVEVAVVPDGVMQTLAEIAARAESLAARVEEIRA